MKSEKESRYNETEDHIDESETHGWDDLKKRKTLEGNRNTVERKRLLKRYGILAHTRSGKCNCSSRDVGIWEPKPRKTGLWSVESSIECQLSRLESLSSVVTRVTRETRDLRLSSSETFHD